MAEPHLGLRRSPLARALEAAGIGPAGAGASVTVTGLRSEGSGGAPGVAICDLSLRPRLGFKGRGTIATMQALGVVVEAVPNRAFRQPDGGLCLVLAPGEVILLSNAEGDGAGLARMEAQWRLEDEQRTYPMPRFDSHAWLQVAGPQAPEMFAKICGVDLRPARFADLAIAQTSIAKMSAIVVRADAGNATVYHVLADSAAALYFSSCLLDAAAEFGGRLVEPGAVQELADVWEKSQTRPA